MEETPRDQREVSPTRIILLSYTYLNNDCIITLTQSVTTTGAALGGTEVSAVSIERTDVLEILASGKLGLTIVSYCL